MQVLRQVVAGVCSLTAFTFLRKKSRFRFNTDNKQQHTTTVYINDESCHVLFRLGCLLHAKSVRVADVSKRYYIFWDDW